MAEKAPNLAGAVNSLLTGLLGIVFVTLKLTGTIDWSWWWVLSPFWGPVAIVLVIAILAIPGVFLKTYYDDKKRKETLRKLHLAD